MRNLFRIFRRDELSSDTISKLPEGSQTSNTSARPIFTEGGSHLEKDVNVSGDFAGRDINISQNYYLIPTSHDSKPGLSSVEINSLLSKGIQLRLEGKLSAAMETLQYIKMAEPNILRVNLEISALQAEMNRARRMGYLNDYGEIIGIKLVEVYRGDDTTIDNGSNRDGILHFLKGIINPIDRGLYIQIGPWLIPVVWGILGLISLLIVVGYTLIRWFFF